MVLLIINKIISEVSNYFSIFCQSTDYIESAKNKTPDPRAKVILDIFGPIIKFLIDKKISPVWISVVIMGFIFYFLIYRNFKKNKELSGLLYIGLFILLFLITISIISQIVLLKN
jgi:hypothetical protein